MTEPTIVGPASASRPIAVRVIAVLVFALGLNALKQIPQFLPGGSEPSTLLGIEQLVVGLAGLTAGFLAWRQRPVAWILVVAWGVASTVLILSLPSELDLAPEESAGIRYGAAVIAGFTVWAAWYLRRALVPRGER